MQKQKHKPKPKQKMYTFKEVEMIAKRSSENVLLGVLAVLVDRHKYRDQKLEDFMKEVAFVMRNPDLVNRQDLRDIILKYGNARV